MKRPAMTDIHTAVSTAIRTYGLKPDWNSIGRMLDLLPVSPVKTWLEQVLSSYDTVTRSCHIAAFFEFVELSAVAKVARVAYKELQDDNKQTKNRVSKRQSNKRFNESRAKRRNKRAIKSD